MAIELPKEVRDQAVASIQRYMEAESGERMGNRAASALRGYFLEEIAPVVYNQAVTEVQERLQARVAEIDIDVFESPFGYWAAREKAAKKR